MNALKNISALSGCFWGLHWLVLCSGRLHDKIGKTTEATKANVTLQWSIILIIFIPICIGFLIFGYYAIQGAYDHLPESPQKK